jgi:hypothetical protein
MRPRGGEIHIGDEDDEKDEPEDAGNLLIVQDYLLAVWSIGPTFAQAMSFSFCKTSME